MCLIMQLKHDMMRRLTHRLVLMDPSINSRLWDYQSIRTMRINVWK